MDKRGYLIGFFLSVSMFLTNYTYPSDYRHVVIIQHDGSNYDRLCADGSPNYEVRKKVARKFYESHGDYYDFLVVFTNFNFSFGEEAEGVYFGVKNDVSGIGLPQYYLSDDFGSSGRLQGYIDMGSILRKSGDPGSADFRKTLLVLAHEMAHRWVSYVKYRDASGNIREDLLGKENAHWNFFLDTDGSVMYGSNWRDNGDGTFTAEEVLTRYSPLDLYLMGFYSAEEVRPFFIIEPVPGTPYLSTDIPVAGAIVRGTKREINVSDIIGAMGKRIPPKEYSQKEFRMAFIYLIAPGTTPSETEIEAIDNIRRAWANEFFFLTKGRGIVETELVEAPAGPVAEHPSIQFGLEYLLNNQRGDGSWADDNLTVIRDTSSVIDALRLFGNDRGAQEAIKRGVEALNRLKGMSVDYLSRQASSLAPYGVDISGIIQGLENLQNLDGGWGVYDEYFSEVYDSALVLLTFINTNFPSDITGKAIWYILDTQNPDGGWGDRYSRMSQVLPTSLAVLALRRAYESGFGDEEIILNAINWGIYWLSLKHNTDNGFGDEGSSVIESAMALRAFMENNPAPFHFSPISTTDYLLSHQRADGSWNNSVYQTSEVIKALRWSLTPNLVVKSEGIKFSKENPVEGEKVVVRAKIEHIGIDKINNVVVRFYDADGNMFSESIIPEILKEASVTAEFDTTGKGGGQEIYVVVDPDNFIDEVLETDNRAVGMINVIPAPETPEFSVSSEDITFEPLNVSTLPQDFTIGVWIWNLGKADANGVEVEISENDEVLSVESVDIPARSKVFMEFKTVLRKGGMRRFKISVDPYNLFQEIIETNNVAIKPFESEPTIDFFVSGIELSKNTVNMGNEVIISGYVGNRGTLPGYSVHVNFWYLHDDIPYSIGLRTVDIPEGTSVPVVMKWRPHISGDAVPVIIEVDPYNMYDELDEYNNSTSATIQILPSNLANLNVGYKDISVSPVPLLESKSGVVSAVVRNNGFVDVSNVVVEFYNGNPLSGGSLIGNPQIVSIPKSGSVIVSTDWSPVDGRGDILLFVRVDPENTIEEFDEEDNTAFIETHVKSIPDLAISETGFVPQFPRGRQIVKINVSIINSGEQDAKDVLVRAYDGNPDAGGIKIAEGVIPVLSAGEVVESVLLWDTGEKIGDREIFIKVDPENTILEQREDNNQTYKKIRVQSEDLYVDNPYFSPNGDGIKDTVTLTFRSVSASGLRVSIYDSDNRLIRRIIPEITGEVGRAIWDGRTERGVLADDGEYSMVVESVKEIASGEGIPPIISQIGSINVILDTNRSLLTEAAGSEYLFFKRLIRPETRFFSQQWHPYESSIIHVRTERDWPKEMQETIWNISPVGDNLTLLLQKPEELYDGRYWSSMYNPVFSPDGRMVAFTAYKRTVPRYNELYIVDADGKNLRGLLRDYQEGYGYSELGVVGYPYHSSPIKWVRDCRRIIFFGSYYDENGIFHDSLFLINTDGTGLVEMAKDVWPTCGRENEGFVPSPDGENMAYCNNTDLHIINLSTYEDKFINYLNEDDGFRWSIDGGLIAYVPWDNTRIFIYTVDGAYFGEIIPSDDYSIDGYFDWLPDGESIIYVETKPEECLGEWSPVGEGEYYCDGELIPEKNRLIRVNIFNQEREIVFETEGKLFYKKQIYPKLSPDGRVLIFTNDNGLMGLDIEKGKMIRLMENPEVYNLLFSPLGRYFMFEYDGLYNTINLLNLTSYIIPVIQPNNYNVAILATAQDKNLEGFKIEYANINSPDLWKPVMPESTSGVVETVVANWVPPGEGTYLIKITAFDRAGNVEEDIEKVSYGLGPKIANVVPDLKYISPNGDDVQDYLTVSYTVLRPGNFDFKFIDEQNRVVRTITRSHDEKGDYFFLWDGTDENNYVVSDGKYTLYVEPTDTSFEIIVDNTPPDADLSLSPVELIRAMIKEQYPQILSLGNPGCYLTCGMYCGGDVGEHLFSHMSFSVYDKNLKMWRVEYEYIDNLGVLTTFLEGITSVEFNQVLEAEMLDKRVYRLTAEDFAGNRISIVEEPVEEMIDVTEVSFIYPYPGPCGRIYITHPVAISDVIPAVPIEDPDCCPYAVEGLSMGILSGAYMGSSLHVPCSTRFCFGRFASQTCGDDPLYLCMKGSIIYDEFSGSYHAESAEALDIELSNTVYTRITKAAVEIAEGTEENQPGDFVDYSDYISSLFDGRGYVSIRWEIPNEFYKDLSIYYKWFRVRVWDELGREFVTKPFRFDIHFKKKIGGPEPPSLCEVGKAYVEVNLPDSAVQINKEDISYFDIKFTNYFNENDIYTTSITEYSVSSRPKILAKAKYYENKIGVFLDDVSELKECLYKMDFAIYSKRFPEINGVYNAGVINFCSILITDLDKNLSKITLKETFRNKISSIQLLYKSGESIFKSISIPPFEDTTEFLLNTSELEGCSNYELEFLVIDEKGGLYYFPEKSYTRNEQRLAWEITFPSFCEFLRGSDVEIQLGSIDRTSSTLCNIPFDEQRLSFSVKIMKKCGDLAISDLRFYLETPSGEIIELGSIENPPNDSRFSFSTSGLTDGYYNILAEAKEEKGNVYRDEKPVFIDKTMPSVNITDPLDKEVCAQKWTLPDGKERLFIPVYGKIKDNACMKIGLDYSPKTSPTGGIGPDYLFPPCGGGGIIDYSGYINYWDVTGLPSGEYILKLVVKDLGGNLSCSESNLKIDTGFYIFPLVVDTLIFSPNGDGRIDNVNIYSRVDEPAILRGWVEDMENNKIKSIFPKTYIEEEFKPVWDGTYDDGRVASDGKYKIVVEGEDKCSFEDAKWTYVTLDNTPPVVSINSPISEEDVSTLVNISGTADDLNFDKYELYYGRGSSPSDFILFKSSNTPVINDLLGVWNNFGLEPGLYTIKLIGYDRAGNISETSVVVKVSERNIISELKAEPWLFSPNDDSVKDESIITYTIEEDAHITLDIIKVENDEEVLIKRLVSNLFQPKGVYSISWDGRESFGEVVPDGDYFVKISATSYSSFQEEKVSVKVDNTPPVVNVINPEADSFVKGRIDVIATLDDLNFSDYRFSLIEPDGKEIEISSENQKRITYNFITYESLKDGNYKLHFRVNDKAGNTADVFSVFTVDNTPPEVVITQPEDRQYFGGFSDLVDIMGSISDENMYEWRIEYGEGDEPADFEVLYAESILPETEHLFLWEISGISDGLYTIKLVAEDKAGNVSETSIRTIIDNTPPTVLIVNPDGGYVKEAIDIIGTAADENMEKSVLEYSDGREGDAFRWSNLITHTENIENALIYHWEILPPDNLYTLRLTAFDKAGNRAETSVVVTVDTTPPSPPLNLVASLERKNDVLLNWLHSVEEDLAGYNLYRAKIGQKPIRINREPIPLSTYLDEGLLDGEYIYTVKAVDKAGWESEPSNEASIKVDLTPPIVKIVSPEDNARVGGRVDIMGTAFSRDDFKEYRVYIGDELIRRSPVSTSYGKLAVWDTYGYKEEEVYTIRLEGEDIYGNVDMDSVRVTIDNIPPSPPHLISATPSGSNVILVWLENPELDVAGYLLFRNGMIANAKESVIGEIVGYLITDTEYIDELIPDGTYTYWVVAVDEAGNMSEPSNSLDVTVETRPPHATLIQPIKFEKMHNIYSLIAATEDNDVKEVRFQFKDVEEQVWSDIGDPDNEPPYKVDLDTSALEEGFYHFRALAEDFYNNVDPSPEEVLSVIERDVFPPSALTAQVIEDTVNLKWDDSNPPEMVAGYYIYKNGQLLEEKRFVREGVATASSIYSNYLPEKAIDNNASTYWRSASAPPQFWQMIFDRPRLISEVRIIWLRCSYSMRPYYQGCQNDYDISLLVKGKWVKIYEYKKTDKWSPDDTFFINLAPYPIEAEGIKIDIKTGNASYVGIFEVYIQENVLSETNLYSETSLPDGEYKYRVSAVNIFGTESEPSNEVVARVYAPIINEPVPNIVSVNSKIVTGFNANPDSTVEIFSNFVRVGTTPADSSGNFSFGLLLNEGINIITAGATDQYGNRSKQSPPIYITYEPPPSLLVHLHPPLVNNSDVFLNWDVEGDISGVSWFNIYRGEEPEGSKDFIGSVSVEQFNYTDANVKNGIYYYIVKPCKSGGVEGVASNEVSAVVKLPILPSPQDLIVYAPPEGGALDLTWHYYHSSPVFRGFNVYRAYVSGGPYTRINSSLILSTYYRDTGLTNGVEYFYVIKAEDSAGNESEPSNEASGIPMDIIPPPPPVLFYPTVANKSVRLFSSLTDIAGETEPDLQVELYRNDMFKGMTSSVGVSPRISQETLSSSDIYYFDISPDGKAIAYETWDRATHMFKIVIERFEDSKMITLSGDGDYYEPRWSPDGTKIVYSFYSYDEDNADIYIYDIFNAEKKRITTGPGWDWGAVWAPDGNRIAFLSSEPETWVDDIYIYDLTMGEIGQITNTPDESEYEIKWFGDGKNIAYLSFESRTLSITDTLTGTTYLKIPSVYAFDISNDGDRIVYVSDSSGHRDIFLYDIASEITEELTDSPANEDFVAFSPLSNKVMFAEDYSKIKMFNLSDGDIYVIKEGISLNYVRYHKNGIIYFTEYKSSSIYTAEIPGYFRFVDKELLTGKNRFIAKTVDSSGNRTSSEPIEVIFDTSNLPDLIVEDLSFFPEVPADGEKVLVKASVKNIGNVSASEVEVQFLDILPDGSMERIGTIQKISGDLTPQSEYEVGVILDTYGKVGANTIIAVADPLNSIIESREDNNTMSRILNVAGKEEVLVMSTALNGYSFLPYTNLEINVSLINPGMEKALTVETVIEDIDGYVIEPLQPEYILKLGYGEEYSFWRTFNVGDLPPGIYRVKVKAEDMMGVFLDENIVEFEILPDVRVLSSIVSDKLQYLEGEWVNLLSTLTNISVNSDLTDVNVIITVKDEGGDSVWEESFIIPIFVRSASKTISSTFSTSEIYPGRYNAYIMVFAGEVKISEGSSEFEIRGIPVFSGSISALPDEVKKGEDVLLRYEIKNIGSEDAFSVNVITIVVDAENGLLISQFSDLIDLPRKGEVTNYNSLSTTGLEHKNYTAMLKVASSGNLETLATTIFRVKDGLAPQIVSFNVEEGGYYQKNLILIARVDDNYSGVKNVEYAIDSSFYTPLPRISGTSISGEYSTSLSLNSEGEHTIVIRASDNEGNDENTDSEDLNPIFRRFVIDFTPPDIQITNVQDGSIVNQDVNPVVTITDLNLAQQNITLNGIPFISGTPITDEGDYLLVASATDKAGNYSVKQVRFTIDKTPPEIIVNGVGDGFEYNEPVTPVISVIEDNLKSILITLNGQPFVSGTPVTEEGDYILYVRAEDLAGNISEKTITFSIIFVRLDVKKELLTKYSNVLVWLTDDLCEKAMDSTIRVRNFIEDALSSIAARVDFAYTNIQFLDGFRSGIYNTYIIVDIEDGHSQGIICGCDDEDKSCCEDGCSKKDEDCEDEELCGGCLSLNKIAVEITEAVDNGAGLVVIKDTPVNWSKMLEVLGLKFEGVEKSRAISLEGSAITEPGEITLRGEKVAVDLKVETANVVAHYKKECKDKKKCEEAPAIAINTFGKGVAVAFSFDITEVIEEEKIKEIIRRSVEYVRPSEITLFPSAVFGVEINIKNLARAVDLVVTETFPEGITPEIVLDGGNSSSDKILWQFTLPDAQTKVLRYFARLSDEPESYLLTTDIHYITSGILRYYNTYPLMVTLTQSSIGLHEDALEKLNALDVDKGEKEKKEKAIRLIEGIKRREVKDICDIQKNIEDTKKAIYEIKKIKSVDISQCRFSLDYVLEYWMRRWWLISP